MYHVSKYVYTTSINILVSLSLYKWGEGFTDYRFIPVVYQCHCHSQNAGHTCNVDKAYKM